MELFDFQRAASDKIAKRLNDYLQDPLYISSDKIVPFYQILSSITGSGKTLILADSIEQIRVYLQSEPIVLWLSKGKVVVGQTLDNLQNGKYNENIPNYDVKPLLECKELDITDDEKGLLLIATVGKINHKDKEDGDRKVFKTGFDNADHSLWELLKTRKNSKGIKRDLIVVYDEGHNLSDQQTQLLEDLAPTALISASATTKTPKALEWYLRRLEKEKQMNEEDFVVSISNSDVVNSGLIKKHISVGGYLTPMELAINNLLEDMKLAKDEIMKYNAKFSPKAIYVSDTNMLLSTSEVDDILVPFEERKARPIQIWKHLVSKGVSPSDIAVYCNLKFDKRFPKPNNFNLFSGGDNDYDEFINGSYKHIIFNQSLQEGWDDPACYFAYIDKDMGSNTQVTQTIGRVLRQPNSTHYNSERLNMASFYIKTDEKDVFMNIIEDIKKTLLADIPEITISYHTSNSKKRNDSLIPPRQEMELPDVAIISDDAKIEVANIVDEMMDYSGDNTNTKGSGEKISIVSSIGANKSVEEIVEEEKHSNKVTARWVFKRELEKLSRSAINLCDIANPKFDALIEYNSRAATHIRSQAHKIADIYRQNSRIVQNPLDTTLVGDVFITNKFYKFHNSIHSKYSDFNDFELDFAKELDAQNIPWMRNPQNGFLKIKLLDGKGTNNFNPDFIVWKEKEILALDTKGSHLIDSDSQRKLFQIDKLSDGKDLTIKLISEKQYNAHIQVIDNKGYTVWEFKQGQVLPTVFSNLSEAVKMSIR